MTLHVGDVVRLKSGGPKMTVSAVVETDVVNPYVQCMWFGGFDGKTHNKENFVVDILDLVGDDSVPTTIRTIGYVG